METKNFESSKNEILKRAKEANACSSQYGRAYKADSVPFLLGVIKDNINFASNNMGVDAKVLSDLFSENDLKESHIYTKGEHFLELREGEHKIILLGSSSANVKTWGSSSANVETWGSSSANVETLDSSSANVETLDSSSKLTKEVKSLRSYIRSHNDNTIYVLTDSDLRLKND